MRIGILTQPLQNNYGGLLQNYALQKILEGYGHNVITIDHGYRTVSFLHHSLSDLKKYLLHIIKPSKYKLPPYIPNEEEMGVIRKNTIYFIEKYIKHTPILHSKEEFKNIAFNHEYDAFVVGSDQCWRYKYNGAFFEEMFLGFLENTNDVGKVAYAVSFGTDKWELNKKMTDRCSHLAKKFNCISVREDSGILLCKEYLDVDAYHVLDPTMLLNKNSYIALVNREKETKSKGDLFYYFLDPIKEKMDLVKQIGEQQRLTPFTTLPKCLVENRTREDVKSRINDCVYPSVTSWLRSFMDAKMVIVDSFHGMVFSIIFNKPFWLISNASRGNARFESLLKMVNLEKRMVSIPLKEPINWNSPIEWDKVNSKIDVKRKFSIDYLLESLAGFNVKNNG